jgi:hypothetical protein
MKIRCKDGIKRNFIGSRNPYGSGMTEIECEHCGELFGVYELKFIKDRLSEHTCEHAKKEKIT